MSLKPNFVYQKSKFVSEEPLVRSMTDFRFHPHTLPKLFLKNYPYYSIKELQNIYKKYVYNNYFVYQSEDMVRGIELEDDSINIMNKAYPDEPDYQKNEITEEYGLVQGTCDILAKDEIIDIKTKRDIRTFEKSTYKSNRKQYFWQLVGYVYIYNKENGYQDFSKASICDVLPEEGCDPRSRVKKFTYTITKKDLTHLEETLNTCYNILQEQLNRDLWQLMNTKEK